MTDIKEKQNHFSKLKCIAISGIFNKPTGKEHLLFICCHCGMDFSQDWCFFQTFSMGRTPVLFVAGSYAFLGFFLILLIGRKSGRKGLTSR
uniref:hypothetical protein n=1 Tax=Escherichia coli TaxID=562 RepID=UPI001F3E6B33|nr:hypothetical protein [Escherichia coli]